MAELLPLITVKDVHAVRALIAGRATADQQLTAVKWLMEQACRRYDSPWTPGGADAARQSDFLAGRHYVGMVFNQMLSPKVLEDATKRETSVAIPVAPPAPTVVRKRPRP